VRHEKREKPTARQDSHDLSHFLFETDFKNTICLINDECFQVLEDEAFCALSIRAVSRRSMTRDNADTSKLTCR